jgi:glycosyltransferase involved in cell wall biosynthesis
MVQSYFSVIMATRNRPAEIIVVNDGSDDECRVQYSEILNTINGVPVQVVSLVQRPNGHGQSFAINSGVGKATAPYVCFLDDDDYWTDPCSAISARLSSGGRYTRTSVSVGGATKTSICA